MLFVAMALSLILHHPMEELLGLPKNTLLLAIPMLGATVALIMEDRRAVELVEKKTDLVDSAVFHTALLNYRELQVYCLGLIHSFRAHRN